MLSLQNDISENVEKIFKEKTHVHREINPTSASQVYFDFKTFNLC